MPTTNDSIENAIINYLREQEEQEAAVKLSYVRTDNGTALVQVPDDNPHGFYLCDDEQSWDGGFGIANGWTLISAADLSDDELEQLGSLDCYGKEA